MVAVDPTEASLDVARTKPCAALVTWLRGDATTLPPMRVDVAIMTDNVAQVFVTDESWQRTLESVREAVADGGHFVFETRDPATRGWKDWRNRPVATRSTSAGSVEYSIELTAVETAARLAPTHVPVP